MIAWVMNGWFSCPWQEDGIQSEYTSVRRQEEGAKKHPVALPLAWYRSCILVWYSPCALTRTPQTTLGLYGRPSTGGRWLGATGQGDRDSNLHCTSARSRHSEREACFTMRDCPSAPSLGKRSPP
jgi:hypothetical protein